jgi:hypothetical protein
MTIPVDQLRRTYSRQKGDGVDEERKAIRGREPCAGSKSANAVPKIRRYDESLPFLFINLHEHPTITDKCEDDITSMLFVL